MSASLPTRQDIRYIWAQRGGRSQRGGPGDVSFFGQPTVYNGSETFSTFSDPTEVYHVTDET